MRWTWKLSLPLCQFHHAMSHTGMSCRCSFLSKYWCSIILLCHKSLLYNAVIAVKARFFSKFPLKNRLSIFNRKRITVPQLGSTKEQTWVLAQKATSFSALLQWFITFSCSYARDILICTYFSKRIVQTTCGRAVFLSTDLPIYDNSMRFWP